jgi:hypothetical protein
MNWIFDTYSNVYSTAMMQNTKTAHHSAPVREVKTASAFARLIGRA